MELDKARELGAQAFRDGKQRAPILNRQVEDAVRGFRVGDGASAIFNAYTGGWDDAQKARELSERMAAVHAAASR